MSLVRKITISAVILSLSLFVSVLKAAPTQARCNSNFIYPHCQNTGNYKCVVNPYGDSANYVEERGIDCEDQSGAGSGYSCVSPNSWACTTISYVCDTNAEAKAICAESVCKGKTDCSIFSANSDQVCCNAVSNNCSQCLKYNNVCTPPEISNVDWGCVYANNCQDAVWAAGCQSFAAGGGPKCTATIPTGTYYPGQTITLSGEATARGNPLRPISSFSFLAGGLVDGHWTGGGANNCNTLKDRGAVLSTSQSNLSYAFKFDNGSLNQSFNSVTSNDDTIGYCNADPYRACATPPCGTGCYQGSIGSCKLGASTAALNPLSTALTMNWTIPATFDGAVSATWKANDSAGGCTGTGSFSVQGLSCQNFVISNNSGTRNQSPIAQTIYLRLTSTNPKSSYKISTTSCTGIPATGFPFSYNQSIGSANFTNYSYINDDDTNKYLPDGTTPIIKYSGGGWNKITANTNPNSDGSRYFNNQDGKKVTIYFVGSSVTVYGWAWERKAKNSNGTVTKPQFTYMFDDTDAGLATQSYLGSTTDPCTFRAPIGNAGRNEYAPICTIEPTTSKTGVRKLVLTTANDNNLYFEGVQINDAFRIPFTIPANTTGSCTFTGTVTNNYGVPASCGNKGLTVNGIPDVRVTISGAPVSCVYGSSINASAAITNSGQGPAQNVNFRFKFNGVQIGNVENLGTIAAGASVTRPYSRPCTDSVNTSHTVTAEIDPVQNDTSSTDNSANFTYQIVPRASYFQTIGGGITSLGTIKSPLPSVGEYLSKNSGKPDAGIISSPFINTLDKGLGHFSQNGTANPGWNRGATSTPRIDELTYTKLYNTVLTNAGVDSSLTNIRNLCNTATALAVGYFDSGSYRIFCYKNTGEIAQAVNAPTTNTSIIIPHPSYSTSNPNPGNFLVAAGKKVILFITPNPADLGSTTTLSTPATVTVDPTNTTGLVTIVNGDINATSSTRLDGLYLFSGQFNSGSGSNPLLGNGSLIGTGTINLTRTHGTTGAISPAELWTYQPKYLWLFRNILTQPSYSWKELPPE